MPKTVAEARTIVEESVLHTDANSFTPIKLDEAIQAACNRFLRETKTQRSTRSLSVTTGTSSYDLATEFTAGFGSDQIVGVPYLAAPDYRPVQIFDFEVIRREYDASASSGRPDMIAFHGSAATVYPTPDDNYTVTMNTWELIDTTNWEIGGTDDTTLAITLNVPEQWVRDVLWWGGRAYMIYGAPGHDDDRAAMGEFLNIIERAKGTGQRSGRTWPSFKGNISQAYGPRRL